VMPWTMNVVSASIRIDISDVALPAPLAG
jgi:hypothetical protein